MEKIPNMASERRTEPGMDDFSANGKTATGPPVIAAKV